jgi:hypothetical protein
MATHVKIVSVSMTQYENSMLAPAPNVTDWEYMKSIIDADTTPAFESLSNAVGKPLKILTSYRGWDVYLAGGLSYIRTNPTSFGGNGYISIPKSGKEMGRMHWNGSVFEIEVEYLPTLPIPLSSNVLAVCTLMQVRMNLGKAGMKPEKCLSDIKILEGIREDIEAFESSLVPTGSDLD